MTCQYINLKKIFIKVVHKILKHIIAIEDFDLNNEKSIQVGCGHTKTQKFPKLKNKIMWKISNTHRKTTIDLEVGYSRNILIGLIISIEDFYLNN